MSERHELNIPVGSVGDARLATDLLEKFEELFHGRYMGPHDYRRLEAETKELHRKLRGAEIGTVTVAVEIEEESDE